MIISNDLIKITERIKNKFIKEFPNQKYTINISIFDDGDFTIRINSNSGEPPHMDITNEHSYNIISHNYLYKKSLNKLIYQKIIQKMSNEIIKDF